MKVMNSGGESLYFELVLNPNAFFSEIFKLSSNGLGLIFTFEQYELELLLELLNVETIEDFLQMLRDRANDDGSMVLNRSIDDGRDVLITCINEG